MVDRLLAVLADPTRRAIVDMLSVEAHRAGEIHAAFPIADPAISRHLRVLREAGVIVERRGLADGRVRLYELAPSALVELATWIIGLTQSKPPEQAQSPEQSQSPQQSQPPQQTQLPGQAQPPGQPQLDAFRDYANARTAGLKRSPT